MDNHEAPQNTNSTTEKDLPHSGNLGLERPVEEYDNTPLPQAFEEHLTDTGGNVIVPGDPSALSSESEPEKPKKKKGLIAGLSVAGAAAIAATSMFLLPKGDDGANNAPEKPEPVATAPANPGETEAPVETEAPIESPSGEQLPTVEALQIPSETTPEEAPKVFAERLSSWLLAGSVDSVYDEYMAFEGTVDEFAQQKAAEYAPIYAEALFGANWQSNPGYVNMVDAYQAANTNKLAYWLITAEDEHPYDESLTAVSSEVTSADDTGISVNVVLESTNNASENKIGSKYHPELLELNGKQRNATIQLKNENGALYITSYSIEE